MLMSFFSSLCCGDEGSSCVPVAELYPFFMMTRMPSFLLKTWFATPVVSPLCQKPPSPMIVTVRFAIAGFTAEFDARPRP